MIIREFRKDESLEKLRKIIDSWISEANLSSFSIKVSIGDGMKDLEKLVCLDSNRLFVMENENEIVGMLGINLFKCPYGTEVMAQEHYFYVLPGYRMYARRLEREARNWGRKMGAKHLILTASAAANPYFERVGEFYKKIGYKPFEVSHIREI